MTAPPAPDRQLPPAETLEPGLLRLIEALARAHVDEDYRLASHASEGANDGR